MGKIYSNQPFKIELTYTELPVTPEEQKICYIDPQGEKGSFTALLNTQDKNIYYYSGSGETLGKVGVWKFWAKITDSGGNVFPGEPTSITIYAEGQ